MFTKPWMDLVALISFSLRLCGLRSIILDGRMMCGAGIRDALVLRASHTTAEQFVDGPVDGLAKNVPQANIGGSGIPVRPVAASGGHQPAADTFGVERGTVAAPRCFVESVAALPTCTRSTRWRVERAVQAVGAAHAGRRTERRQHIQDALADKRGFRPVQPTGRRIPVAERVVPFDAALRNDADKFAALAVQ